MDAIAQAAEDIRTMRVRGAAKIGRHAVEALGRFAASGWDGEPAALDRAEAALVATRPTAVSLRNAVAFAVARARRAPREARAAALVEAAREFEARAKEALAAIGRHGAPLVPDGGGRVLTICNSQGALEPLREAWRQGKRFEVVALETRPWRQGLLTVRQLHEAGIPASLAVDSAAWHLLRETDLVLVGADTWAANGDVINKVGTGGLAMLARKRGVPFHSCAETFKVDLRAPTGAEVVIEEREAAEVARADELPEGVRVLNPVFDVTPNEVVRGYVTELGILKAGELAGAARKAWELTA